MATTKKEVPIEGEIIEEIKINTSKSECCTGGKRGGSGMFFGTIFLVWGVAILADTYFGIDISRNIWPILAVVFGVYLISSSFKN